ncbi:hypothetical protein [Piscinibacter terrae]|uniref:BACON domain-containing protein n=1 Tax=Piscinibacter terrae TaxID=2496871 RepID=A0A3N7HPH7_9BURK|nr:hypothetical protein [Albitalea terrae]RQP23016.1 hypothetical protein DZC73_17965 [Albitalea terrae]
MMTFRSAAFGSRRLFACLVALGLSACGGGGGGDNGSGTLTVNVASVSLQVEQGTEIANTEISGSITGATQPVYLSIVYTNSGISVADFQQTSSTTGKVIISPRDPLSVSPGVYHDTVTVSACYDPSCNRPVGGSPKVVPVTYTVKAPTPPAALVASDRAVAFSSTPSGNVLTRTLSVSDNTGATSTWTSSSSASWLSATSGGSSGGSLVLSADPSSLDEGLHLATVTLTSSNPAISGAETVRVGLYKSSAAASAIVLSPPSGVGSRAAADPIRPLRYAASGSTIVAHHFYTGELIGTIDIAGGSISSITTSDDGSRLYALDAGNTKLVTVDLDNFSVTSSTTLPDLTPPGGSFSGTQIVHARASGRSAIVLSEATRPSPAGGLVAVTPVIDPTDGRSLGRVFGFDAFMMSHFSGTHGAVAYTAPTCCTGGLSVQRIELKATSNGGVFGQTTAASILASASLQSVAASPDGASVLVAEYSRPTLYQFRYNGTTLSDVGGAPGGTTGFASWFMAYSPNGRLAVLRLLDLLVYNADGTLAHTYPNLLATLSSTNATGQVVASSDGLRLLINDNLVDLGP